MLTTPIYGFKKPELADSPPDITATNPNWDKTELELKKNADAAAENSSAIGQIKNVKIIDLRVVNFLNYIDVESGYEQTHHFRVIPGSTANGAPELSWGVGYYSIQTATDAFCVYIGQTSNFINRKVNGSWLGWKEIATTEVITKTLTATNGATGTVYMSRTAGKVIAIDAVLTVSSSIPTYTNFCSISGADRPVRDVYFDMKMTNGIQKILCGINAGSGFQTLSQSIPAGIYFVSVSYIAGT